MIVIGPHVVPGPEQRAGAACPPHEPGLHLANPPRRAGDLPRLDIVAQGERGHGAYRGADVHHLPM